jgi:hypothetical protein
MSVSTKIDLEYMAESAGACCLSARCANWITVATAHPAAGLRPAHFDSLLKSSTLRTDFRLGYEFVLLECAGKDSIKVPSLRSRPPRMGGLDYKQAL